MVDLIMPELGEGVVKATIACWHFNEGDKVTKDDDVVELVTDKATFNVPAPQEGVLKDIKFKDGEQADVGAVLAIIE